MEKATLTEVWLTLEIKNLYAACKRILSILPRFIAAAQDQNLKIALTAHTFEVHQQIDRLDEAAALLGFKPFAGSDRSIASLHEAAATIASDLGVIAAANQIVRHEIAGYRTCLGFAETLGHAAVVHLLDECLWEELGAERSLRGIASRITPRDEAITARPIEAAIPEIQNKGPTRYA